MNYAKLLAAIDATTQELRGHAALAVNRALVIRNWLVGAFLIQFEQRGRDRAKYGEHLLERIAADLRMRGSKGLDARTLRDCRMVFRIYPQMRASLESDGVSSKLRGVLSASGSVVGAPAPRKKIRGRVSPESPPALPSSTLLQLSWSKLQELVRIEDPWKRAFYEMVCIKGRWSVRQLQRQIGSLLFERTGMSTDRNAVLVRARREEPAETAVDLVRDPYVLEFTGLSERPVYRESDLETALLEHLQAFLLELGEGFCFEARQKRIKVGRNHDYIDLVFYHRRLRCHVLVDLKVRPFQHGDAGQMNAYLNWWKANGMESGDQPPIGIILCSDKEHAAVEFATAGMDNQLFVSRYLVALPAAEKLRAFLEADRERIEGQLPRVGGDGIRTP